jgi:hypothetical protein
LLTALVAGATLLTEAEPQPAGAHQRPAGTRPAGLSGRPDLLGLTESFGPYCGHRLDADLPPAKAGSCGRPFPGVEVRVVDPDTGGERPLGEQGEISLRGPNLMRGILGRARSSVFTVDGWYRTGDLGRLDEDGYLWFGGRIDDPGEVERGPGGGLAAAAGPAPGDRPCHHPDP